MDTTTTEGSTTMSTTTTTDERNARWAIEDTATSLRYRSTFPHWTADDNDTATFTEAEAMDAKKRMGRNGKTVRVVAAR